MDNGSSDLSIVLSGEAGQGLKTLEVVFAKIVKANGFHVSTYTEFMSRIRGGNNTTEIRVSSMPCPAFVDRIDIAVSFQKDGLQRIASRLSADTVIIGEQATLDEPDAQGRKAYSVPLSSLAKESGGVVMLNTVAMGMLCALLCFDPIPAIAVLKANLKRRDPATLDNNEKAFGKGYAEGERIRLAVGRICPRRGEDSAAGRHLLYGSDAIGIGALAGGCNFVVAYPMSPATSVLEFMARHASEFGVVLEQAEDEIAVVNMAIGSWYAGGRALASTAGGGFALMEEGLSLAGCIESPLVIHVGQRPGPATGLPTRTEQGDLNLALYAGHGEFPRAIFAPATFEDGIRLTCRAFNLADKYQIPVFVLTDQYFLDSSRTMDRVDLSECAEEKYICLAEPGYKRYALTKNGISPRAVPSNGSGLVCVDSDEHDEAGYITEDFGIRKAMVDKRLKKLEALTREAIAPRFIGPDSYEVLLVGWGCTYETLAEALQRSGRTDAAVLHFSQVYPVSAEAAARLKTARKRVIVENNATAQFGALLTRETGLPFHGKILKYSGMPFSVEELVEAVKQL